MAIPPCTVPNSGTGYTSRRGKWDKARRYPDRKCQDTIRTAIIFLNRLCICAMSFDSRPVLSCHSTSHCFSGQRQVCLWRCMLLVFLVCHRSIHDKIHLAYLRRTGCFVHPCPKAGTEAKSSAAQMIFFMTRTLRCEVPAVCFVKYKLSDFRYNDRQIAGGIPDIVFREVDHDDLPRLPIMPVNRHGRHRWRTPD